MKYKKRTWGIIFMSLLVSAVSFAKVTYEDAIADNATATAKHKQWFTEYSKPENNKPLTVSQSAPPPSEQGIDSRIFIVARGSKNLGWWQQCSLSGTSDPSASWRTTSVSRSGSIDSRGFSNWVVSVNGPGSGSYGASVTCWKMK